MFLPQQPLPESGQIILGGGDMQQILTGVGHEAGTAMLRTGASPHGTPALTTKPQNNSDVDNEKEKMREKQQKLGQENPPFLLQERIRRAPAYRALNLPSALNKVWVYVTGFLAGLSVNLVQ